MLIVSDQETAHLASLWVSKLIEDSERKGGGGVGEVVVVGIDVEWRPSFTRGQDNPASIMQVSRP